MTSDPIAARTILVSVHDYSELMHAIDRAELRMDSLARAPSSDYASAAIEELRKIRAAKIRYDAAVARAERERVLS